SSSASLNKKTVISTQKTSQLTKANQKQSSNSTTVNKHSSTVLPFKPKTVQSQTSTNNNNNTKERSGLTKPTSSSVESRQI
ncbi:unnamed protein product, partial [Rotaria magnacalcarata]